MTLLAYIGPGAGFVFGGTFIAVIAAVVSGFLSLFLWPIRVIRRAFTGAKAYRDAKVRRVVFLGLDGLDPKLAERYMGEGKLPNFSKLAKQGHYSRLRTTFPCLSPVAWSSFATGANPAKHNIFGFLSRNPKTYAPELSSSKVGPPARVLKLFGREIPLGGPQVEMRRKSVPFWKLLGEEDIHATILRIPITFPPQEFNGHMLSAMCTPDLRGTQGSFSFYSTAFEKPDQTQGLRLPLSGDANLMTGEFWGPPDPQQDDGSLMRLPFEIRRVGPSKTYKLTVDGRDYELTPGKYSEWVSLRFHSGVMATAKGIVRVLITATEPNFELYSTPINIDPSTPALPISHPASYAVYLSKLMGSYATLGLAEDTWALNENVIDEDAFLEQAWLYHQERETMFFNALEKTPRGVVACVFDASDRIQHMFYRYFIPDHPANKDRDTETHKLTIEKMYQRMDDLVSQTLERIDQERDLLFILSDHGFESFVRGMNLNAWLRDEGYLVLKDGRKESGDYFEHVDWSRTKAYTVGLGGIFLNRKGREAKGIVTPGKEAEALKREIKEKLHGYVDEERGVVAVRKVAISSKTYRGPYLGAGPDLLIGYAKGYRASWAAATGGITEDVFEDNIKAWGGDHCIDPDLVPGVLFSNRSLDANDPGIEDLAPTTMVQFGLPVPKHMEGKPLIV